MNKNKQKKVLFALVLLGALLGGGVLLSSLPSGARESITEVVSFTDPIGSVAATPACVSSAVPANASCASDGTAYITFSWSGGTLLGYFSGSLGLYDLGCWDPELQIRISTLGGADRRVLSSQYCNGSHTFFGLLPGQTYEYAFYGNMNWVGGPGTEADSTHWDLTDWYPTIGTFTTPSCLPPPPPPPPVAAPTLSFSAAPTSLPAGGGTTTFSWTTTNAVSCLANNSNGLAIWSGEQGAGEPVAKSKSVLVPATTIFRLECWNSVGVSSGQKSVTVSVSPPPPPPVCSVTDNYGPCDCTDEMRTHTRTESNCSTTYLPDVACTADQKNSLCRDFNWKEVAP